MNRRQIEEAAREHQDDLVRWTADRDRLTAERDHAQSRLEFFRAALEELRQDWLQAEEDPWLASWRPGTADPAAVRSECMRLNREEEAKVVEATARLLPY